MSFHHFVHREREDTVRSIVTSLTEESDLSEELFNENRNKNSSQTSNSNQFILLDEKNQEDSDYEDDWIPDPVHVDPGISLPLSFLEKKEVK